MKDKNLIDNLTKCFWPTIEICEPYLIHKDDPFANLCDEAPNLYQALHNLRPVVGTAMKAALQINTGIGDCFHLTVFASQYPWRGKISRADHLRLTWNMYQHCCYVLNENIFLFLNSLKKAESACHCEAGEINFKKVKSDLKRTIGEHIRSRGSYTHAFPEDPSSILMLQLTEMLKKETKGHFTDARLEILTEIRETNTRLCGLLTTEMSIYWERLRTTVVRFNEICDLALDPSSRSRLRVAHRK